MQKHHHTPVLIARKMFQVRCICYIIPQNRTLFDPDWRRGSGGELQCAVLEGEGRPTAYALYRMNSAFVHGLQSGAVAVIEAIGKSPQATGAIWRYLLDIDWMARVRVGCCRSIIRCCCYRRSRAGSALAYGTASGCV